MIIGITGTLGAGKGTVAEYLVKKHNFTYLSVRNLLAGEVVRRGLMLNRDNLIRVANDLRAEHHSPSWAVEWLLNEAASQTHVLKQKDVVIESIRTIGEAQLLKSKGAKLWAVDADIGMRYQRAVKRATETDAVSFEQFKANEEQEMHSDDPNKQNLAAVREMADVTLTNDGTPEELFAKVEEALKKASV